jgi:hypothetical protein
MQDPVLISPGRWDKLAPELSPPLSLISTPSGLISQTHWLLLTLPVH